VNLTVEAVEDGAVEIGMRILSKQAWLDAAEIFDAWRIVPRTIIFMIAHMVISLDTTLVYWYIHLPAAQRSTADAAAVGSIVTVLSTLFGVSLKFYIDNGRSWTTK
jgi:hypothetical protein